MHPPQQSMWGPHFPVLNNIRVRHQMSQPSRTCACREELNVQFRLSAAVPRAQPSWDTQEGNEQPVKGPGCFTSTTTGWG